MVTAAELDDWTNAQYTNEKADNIQRGDTSTPGSNTSTGIKFRGKTVQIPINTKSTWQAQKNAAYDKLRREYQAKLLSDYYKREFNLQTPILGGTASTSRTLGSGQGTAASPYQVKTGLNKKGIYTTVGTERYRIRSPEVNGVYYESVQNLTPARASALRSRGYSLNIVATNVPVASPQRFKTGEAVALQSGGVNFRGNSRVPRQATAPVFTGTKRKSQLLDSRRIVR